MLGLKMEGQLFKWHAISPFCKHDTRLQIAAPLSHNVCRFVIATLNIFFLAFTGSVTPCPFCGAESGGSLVKRKANVTIPRGLIGHTLVHSKQHSPDSVWQTGRGRRMTMNHWCSAHRSQTKHKYTHTHPHTNMHTNTTDACTHIRLLSLTYPFFPICSVVFFSLPPVILWWQRQMKGFREDSRNSRRRQISLCHLLWSKIMLIASIGHSFSALPFASIPHCILPFVFLSIQ